MTKNYFVLFIPLLSLLLSCASAPEPPPPWAESPGGIGRAFPEGEYIAQQGRGRTLSEAEADGAAQIARFFNTRISSSISVREQYREDNGTVQSSTELETETFIQSRMDIFGIRYAGDPFYHRGRKTWFTVAYIDRAEAWRVYAPYFRQQAGAFLALFNAAENETEPFKKALRCLAAQNYAETEEFKNAEALGRLLHPSNMEAEFSDLRSRLAALPQKSDHARRNAGVFILCPDDFEALVSTALSREFSALGFPVAKDRNAATALCTVTIEPGEQKRDLGIFYHPALQAALTGPSGPLWTFNATVERSSAVTPDVAQRRAWTALADQIRTHFRAGFIAGLPLR